MWFLIRRFQSSHNLLMILLLVVMALVTLADQETVDGIQWTYVVTNDIAIVSGVSTELDTITIPSRLGGHPVKEIGNGAFCNDDFGEYGDGFTSVVIPEGVVDIGASAFIGHDRLETVVFPHSLTNIGDHAFGGCSSLTTLILPESLKGIGWFAFSGCSGLTSVTIPSCISVLNNFPTQGLTNVTIVAGPEICSHMLTE